MVLTQDQLKQLIYNPNLIQQFVYESIAENGQQYELSNGSTPFQTILEALSVTGAGLAQEARTVMRSKFPNMATDMTEIFPHLTDTEIINIFSYPSEATFRLSIYAMSLIDNGYKVDDNYSQVIFPEGTNITIAGTIFTLTNPVILKINKQTYVPYAAILPSSNPLAYQNKGTLDTSITTDKIGNPYISFDLPVKQLRMTTVFRNVSEINADVDMNFEKDEKYCYSQVVNSSSSGTKVIKQVFSTEYLAPSEPQVNVALKNNGCSFRVSPIYQTSGQLSGRLSFTIFTTKGNLFLPLETYNALDFIFNIPADKAKGDPSSRASTNLKVVVQGVGVISGGRNSMTIDQIKDSLIYNTTGPINQPVTEYHITETANRSGYNIKLAEDVLTNRIYTAYKELPAIAENNIKASSDIFINTVKLTLEELRKLYPNSVKANSSVIKSNTVFRESNGVMLLADPKELLNIESMSPGNKNNYFKENKYFYNPFTIVIDNENGFTDSRVYQIDTPTVMGFRTIGKNLNLPNVNVNVDTYSIVRTELGYKLYVTIKGDSGFKEINKNNIKTQLTLKLANGSTTFKGVMDTTYGAWVFDIQIESFINSEDQLTVTNGDSPGTELLAKLVSEMYFYVYITDPARKDPFNTYVDEIKVDEDTKLIVSVLSKDMFTIKFGDKLDYVWNKLYNTYNERKFKRYEEDIYLTYESDVYQLDADGNIEFKINPSQTEIEMIVLHKKGEFVLDSEGNKILKHKKGDVILDAKGDPIVDTIPDLVRFIDIIMLEYEFKVTDAFTYARYREIMFEYFNQMLIKELPSINRNLLEKTTILFKPNKSTAPVHVTCDNAKVTIPYIITPKVSIYVKSDVTISLTDIEIYKQKIGNVFVKHLKNNIIKIADIEADIIQTLNVSIESVKVENITPTNGKVIIVEEGSNQPTMAKMLQFTEYKTNIVTYSLDLNIVKL